MKPAPFDYFAPDTLEEALSRLAEADGDGAVIAGGQTLVPLMALRMASPTVLIDINRIPELETVERGAGAVRIGSVVRQAEVLANPTVAQFIPAMTAATALVGHHQTRNRGTIGGSCAFAEPAAEYPATTLTLGARFELRSASRIRMVEADDFFQGPYTTAVEPDEMITAVEFPDWGPGTRTAVREVARRPGDFALVGLVCAVTVDAGQIRRAAIGWFGMGGTPIRSRAAEAALTGQSTRGLDLTGIAELAVSETEPQDDSHADSAYRTTVGRRLLAKTLVEILETAQ